VASIRRDPSPDEEISTHGIVGGPDGPDQPASTDTDR
jgi:hypothetical protein